MKAKILKLAWQELIRLHHEAILVKIYGKAAPGVSPERVQLMLRQGIINPMDLKGLLLPGMVNEVDPLDFMYRVAKITEATPSKQRPTLRERTLEEWKRAVDASITAAPEAPVTLPPVSIPVDMPKPPVEPQQPSPETPPTPSVLSTDVETPEWMSTSEAGAYQSAMMRAGDYCRGLGNIMGDELGGAVEEVWGDVDIEEEADAVLRHARILEIREKVAEALATHRDYQTLALELARTTGKYNHDWERIARTELQGAYNEGIFLEAIEDWGEGAQIARIPETNACPHCLRLFSNTDGTPRIFNVKELLTNGTNVGKNATSWVATIWPVHPNCRCDTLSVPPGMVVNAKGVLEMPKNE